MALLEKDRLIQERLIEFKGPQEGQLWWQDPSWFGASVLSSFVLGLVASRMIEKR